MRRDGEALVLERLLLKGPGERGCNPSQLRRFVIALQAWALKPGRSKVALKSQMATVLHITLRSSDFLAASRPERFSEMSIRTPQPASGTDFLVHPGPTSKPLLPLPSHPAPPVIPGDTQELVEEVTVNASSAVSLECPALGNPAPAVSWFQNGLPVSPSPRLQVLEEGQVLKVRTDPCQGKSTRNQGTVSSG